MLAQRGMSEEKCTPGIEVGVLPNGPLEGRPGFVIANWCGSADCEAHIKTDTQATIRNMPMNAAVPSGTCVRCDRPAQVEAWFAKAY